MRRPLPKGAKPGKNVPDVKSAYTIDQLAEIGAIALTWNQTEMFVDFLLLIVLKMPVGLWTPVAKRINGMEGKLAILRLRAEQSEILTDEARSCIKTSLDAVAEYKTYRDAIVHSLTFDADQGIALETGRKAMSQQVLVTKEALAGLYQRLVLLIDELKSIDLLFRLGDEQGAMAIYRGKPEPLKLRREKDVPYGVSQTRELQRRRLTLPPLPTFPEDSGDWMQKFAQAPRYATFNPETGITGVERPAEE
jgi:hypothetical protein